MSDTIVTTPAAQPASVPAEPATEAPKPEAPAQETDWKAEARKWEERAKANKTAAEKLAEIEEASKTADQKAAERLELAEKRAVELEQKADRAEVAAEKGVPIGLIHGSTRVEMEAAADALIEFRGANTPGAPKPDPSQGAKIPDYALNGDPLLADLKSKLGIN
jgi:hypothetical protein